LQGQRQRGHQSKCAHRPRPVRSRLGRWKANVFGHPGGHSPQRILRRLCRCAGHGLRCWGIFLPEKILDVDTLPGLARRPLGNRPGQDPSGPVKNMPTVTTLQPPTRGFKRLRSELVNRSAFGTTRDPSHGAIVVSPHVSQAPTQGQNRPGRLRPCEPSSESSLPEHR
jgi:hypothetical protein